MSKLDDILKAIIDARQYIDGDTSYMTDEELTEAKQAIKDLVQEMVDDTFDKDDAKAYEFWKKFEAL